MTQLCHDWSSTVSFRCELKDHTSRAVGVGAGAAGGGGGRGVGAGGANLYMEVSDV